MPTARRGDWESYSAEYVTDSLYARPTSSHFIFAPEFLKSATNHNCIFKTREDRLGVLHISGFTDNPRLVKLRYKLVQRARP
jgi:hypothetical protein